MRLKTNQTIDNEKKNIVFVFETQKYRKQLIESAETRSQLKISISFDA